VAQHPEPVAVHSRVEPRSTTRVTGLGVSGGIVEGRVRVLTDPADCDIADGDILVAHITDPSWVTLMFLSAALVVDVGGPLSHTAVVAREMGIPCVANTKTATSTLRTGDLCRVDGTAGAVMIPEPRRPTEPGLRRTEGGFTTELIDPARTSLKVRRTGTSRSGARTTSGPATTPAPARTCSSTSTSPAGPNTRTSGRALNIVLPDGDVLAIKTFARSERDHGPDV
jgi:phosphohistidine swiveling domain-containing protein